MNVGERPPTRNGATVPRKRTVRPVVQKGDGRPEDQARTTRTNPEETMIRRRALTLGALALFAAATGASAQHGQDAMAFDGEWTLTFGSQMGDVVMNLALENDDHVIQGIATSPMGGEMLVEGTRDGAELTFTVFIRQPDHEVDLMFSGELDGDAASGAVDIMGEIHDWTAERSDGQKA
jgi:hypothetical protein